MDRFLISSAGAAATFGVIGAASVWLAGPNAQLPWGYHVVFSLLIVWAVALLTSIVVRKDHVPDLLGTIAKNGYYTCEGFCFAFAFEARDGVAFLRVWFQNQYERPCVAEIGLCPTPRLLRRAPRFECVGLRVECGPAAMGVATLAMPVPADLQGKSLLFDVGASVKYPQGGGRRLRMYVGLPVYWSARRVGKWPRHKDNRPVELRLPSDVDAAIEGDRYQSVRTFWRLGDTPLERWPEDLWSSDSTKPTMAVTGK
ncbi:MAG TPA: hypothetical protein VGN57_09640 [Pirellulaceae bacterium]|jgi:hypothetical protein|nr:hypothetical protein [Pirellulaceae bacterium]